MLSGEVVDAVRAFLRVVRALAEYLDAVAWVEESYGVGLEELLRRVFGDERVVDELSGVDTGRLARFYEAAVIVSHVAPRLAVVDSLSAGEKRELAEMLGRAARLLEEFLGDVEGGGGKTGGGRGG